MHYPETIRPALQVIGAHPRRGLVSGMYMLVFEKHVIFCADTTVNIDPTAEQLAQIALSRRPRSRARSGIEPRIAMLSFSNFGSVRHPDAEKVARGGAAPAPARPVARRRRRDAGRHRARRPRSSRATIRSARSKERGERPDLPEPERGQHRLQAAEPPRRRDGDRTDPRRHESPGARARARRRRAGHREHGGRRRGRRAGALRSTREAAVRPAMPADSLLDI